MKELFVSGVTLPGIPTLPSIRNVVWTLFAFGLMLLVALDAAAQPSVEWSTYLGGTGDDWGWHIAADSSGSVYIAGRTDSSGWVIGGWDTSHNGNLDGYVVKLRATGSHYWSTYLGGTGDDWGLGIALDSSGNIYTTGETDSSGWVSGGWNTIYGGGIDGYVVKLDTAGAHLWSTYLGGTNSERGHGIAVDSNGNVYASGTTASSGWVNDGWDTSYGGSHDGYVVKLSATGTHVWSTYLGGTGYDYGYDLAVDLSGNAYASGPTTSSGWVSGGWNTNHGGSWDAYVVKLNTTGAHEWSTYVGGENEDRGVGIAVNASGNVYATGRTASSGWVSDGWDTSYNGGSYDGYIVKLSTVGAHLWSSYLGGTGEEYGRDIAVDSGGNAYATGETESLGWVSDGWNTIYGGGIDDGYVVKFDTTGVCQWSSYLGGAGEDQGYGIAVDLSGNVYATGRTASSGWVSGGWNTSYNGGLYDGYVAKIDDAQPSVTITSPAPDPTGTVIPVTVTFSEPVTGFELSDITTSNASISSFSGGSALYTFDLTPVSDGLVTADIAAGVCTDAVGKPNEAALQFSRTYNGNLAVVWYVDMDNVSGIENGWSWPTAFRTIQEGVDAAVSGDEVWVAEGTYTSTGDNVVVMDERVYIYGGFMATETVRNERNWTEHETIIDGENLRRCVYGADNATLDGFTVTQGYAEAGGGTGNEYPLVTSPTVGNCTFMNNTAYGFDESGYIIGLGGGMFGDSPTVTNCVFLNNSAYGDSAAYGGGMACASPIVENCVFSGNTAYGGSVLNLGGGMACYSGTVTNCVFLGNTADIGGGFCYVNEEDASVKNCTFSGNVATSGGGAISAGDLGGGGLLTITNCIFWGDTPDEIYGAPVTTATYSCVQGGYSGEGNITSDPNFVDAPNGNLCLLPDSLCIDTATANGAPLSDIRGVSRPQGLGFDMGAYEAYWPLAPSNPGATSIDTNKITWTWQDNSDNEAGFKVYADMGAGPPATLQTTTTADVQSWQYDGLDVNNQYAFQVAATNTEGDSALTTNYSAWTLAKTPVGPVVGLPELYSLYVLIGMGDGNPVYTLYAIEVNPAVGGNTWVQADGTVGDSPVFQTSMDWGFAFVTGLDSGTLYGFQVTARNGAGIDTVSGPITYGMTLITLSITQQPLSQTVPEGGPVTFTVGTSGGCEPISYQWQRDSMDLTGGDQSVYTIPSVEMGHQGSYTVLVSDDCDGEIESDIAILTVLEGMSVTGFAGLTGAVIMAGLLGVLNLKRRTK